MLFSALRKEQIVPKRRQNYNLIDLVIKNCPIPCVILLHFKNMDVNFEESVLPRGFFNRIRRSSGDDVCAMCKDYVNLHKKFVSMKNRTIFLLQCRKQKVFPSHIKNNVEQIYSLQLEKHPYTPLVNNIMENFRRSVLNLEIKITLWKKKELQRSIDKCMSVLGTCLDGQTWTGIREFTLKKSEYAFQRTRTLNKQKLKRLIDDQRQPITIDESEKFLKNYTNIEIPKEARIILGLGPKHGIVPKNVPVLELIKDVECFTQALTLEENQKNEIRGRCTRIIQNFMDGQPIPHDPLKKHYQITSNFLKNNPDIMVGRSDKGNTTVVMYKEEYVREANKLLSDTNIYKILNKDPTRRIQDSINKFLRTLRDSNTITELQYRTLSRHNSIPPKFYCLRKTHKQNICFRPIVSCIGSPSYNIGKFLHSILSDVLCSSRFSVEDSFSFVEDLTNIHVPNNYKLISLDVVSLFTNIPKTLVTQIIKKRWNYISCFTELSRDDFISLVDLTFESSYFTYNNIFYKQIDGTAMGSPTSPSFANLIMFELFEYAVEKLKFNIPLIKVYVDDLILLVPEDQIQTTFNTFSSFHEKLTFTIERENNNSIPFLDMMVIRQDNTLITDWYTKPTNSGRCINFLSNHSALQKKNVATNLIHRALSLSHSKFEEKNVKRVFDILLTNNYPKYYIRKMMNNYRQKQRPTFDIPVQNTDITNNRQYTENLLHTHSRLVFYPKLSYRIQKIFKEFNCTAAFYNTLDNNKRFFTRIKDSTPQSKQSGVVYKIACHNCERVYIGQTKQYLHDRIRQHENDTKHVQCTNKTALTQHTHIEGHKFNFGNTTILDREPHYSRRLLSEMIHIQKHNTVNFREDTENLSITYNNLISRINLPHR